MIYDPNDNATVTYLKAPRKEVLQLIDEESYREFRCELCVHSNGTMVLKGYDEKEPNVLRGLSSPVLIEDLLG